VRFGSPGHDDVPISKAVQASTALPGLYPPVKIGERYFVDGGLKRTLHASSALDEGVNLLFCVNPIVPYDASAAPPGDDKRHDSLVEGVAVTHPAVLEAAAVGIPDEKSGELVKLFVVCREGQSVTEKELIAFCREGLTGYKVPRKVEFRKELPKTNVGKILRRELRDEAS
jgi:hypothetical protein